MKKMVTIMLLASIATTSVSINTEASTDYVVKQSDAAMSECVKLSELNFSNADEMQAFSKDASLPAEVKESIMENYQLAKTRGNTDGVTVTIYGPQNTTATDSQVKGTDTTSYYTYNGHQMKNYQTKYTGLDIPYKKVKTGTKSMTFAKGVSSLVVDLGSATSSTLSLVSWGKALFSFFSDVTSDVVVGNKSDYIALSGDYDKIDQWTYCKVGENWDLGLFSQKVTITKTIVTQYYYLKDKQTGKKVTKTNTMSKTFKSKDFSSPWAKAYSYAGSGYSEKVSAKWGDYQYLF